MIRRKAMDSAAETLRARLDFWDGSHGNITPAKAPAMQALATGGDLVDRAVVILPFGLGIRSEPCRRRIRPGRLPGCGFTIECIRRRRVEDVIVD